MDRRRSAAVTLGLTVFVAAGLTGCSSEATRDTAGYCVDKQTGQRVPDSECTGHSTSHHAHGWYYVRNGSSYPRIGGRATGGSFTAPAGSSYVEGGLSSSGGTVDAGKAGAAGGTVHTVKSGGFGHLGGKGRA